MHMTFVVVFMSASLFNQVDVIRIDRDHRSEQRFRQTGFAAGSTTSTETTHLNKTSIVSDAGRKEAIHSTNSKLDRQFHVVDALEVDVNSSAGQRPSGWDATHVRRFSPSTSKFRVASFNIENGVRLFGRGADELSMGSKMEPNPDQSRLCRLLDTCSVILLQEYVQAFDTFHSVYSQRPDDYRLIRPNLPILNREEFGKESFMNRSLETAFRVAIMYDNTKWEYVDGRMIVLTKVRGLGKIENLYTHIKNRAAIGVVLRNRKENKEVDFVSFHLDALSVDRHPGHHRTQLQTVLADWLAFRMMEKAKKKDVYAKQGQDAQDQSDLDHINLVVGGDTNYRSKKFPAALFEKLLGGELVAGGYRNYRSKSSAAPARLKAGPFQSLRAGEEELHRAFRASLADAWDCQSRPLAAQPADQMWTQSLGRMHEPDFAHRTARKVTNGMKTFNKLLGRCRLDMIVTNLPHACMNEAVVLGNEDVRPNSRNVQTKLSDHNVVLAQIDLGRASSSRESF